MGVIFAMKARLTTEHHVNNQVVLNKSLIESLKYAYSDYYAGQCNAFLNAPNIATLKSMGYLDSSFNENIPEAGPIYLGAIKSIDNIQILTISLKFNKASIAKSVWNEMAGEGQILADKLTYQLAFFPYSTGERGASYTWFSSPNCPS